MKPTVNLIESLKVVNFHNDRRPLVPEEVFSTTQNFVFPALNVYFDELWRIPLRGDEVIQGDGRYLNGGAIGQRRMILIRFNATMRQALRPTSEQDPLIRSVRPNRRVHHTNTLFEMIELTGFPEDGSVVRVTIESDNSPLFSDEPCDTESDNSDVRANIVDNRTWTHGCSNRVLCVAFATAAPVAGFLRQTNPYPHSTRQTRLHSYQKPVIARNKPQECVADNLFRSLCCFRKLSKHESHPATLRSDEVNPVNEEVHGRHRYLRKNSRFGCID